MALGILLENPPKSLLEFFSRFFLISQYFFSRNSTKENLFSNSFKTFFGNSTWNSFKSFPRISPDLYLEIHARAFTNIAQGLHRKFVCPEILSWFISEISALLLIPSEISSRFPSKYLHQNFRDFFNFFSWISSKISLKYLRRCPETSWTSLGHFRPLPFPLVDFGQNPLPHRQEST